MKSIRATELTEPQRATFTQLFYELCPSDLDDQHTPAPWGCPWYHGSSWIIEGDTMEEIVENYLEAVRDEITVWIEEDKKLREEMEGEE